MPPPVDKRGHPHTLIGGHKLGVSGQGSKPMPSSSPKNLRAQLLGLTIDGGPFHKRLVRVELGTTQCQKNYSMFFNALLNVFVPLFELLKNLPKTTHKLLHAFYRYFRYSKTTQKLLKNYSKTTPCYSVQKNYSKTIQKLLKNYSV